VVEAVEHVLRHDLDPLLPCVDGPFDGGDAAGEPPLLLPQPGEVAAQRRRLVGLPVEHVADVREAEPQVAQQQDPLQAHERVGVVAAVAVRPDRGRLQQPDPVVVPQRAARRPGQPGDLLDRGVPSPGRLLARGAHGLSSVVDVNPIHGRS
jgi:hypothetical protein